MAPSSTAIFAFGRILLSVLSFFFFLGLFCGVLSLSLCSSRRYVFRPCTEMLVNNGCYSPSHDIIASVFFAVFACSCCCFRSCITVTHLQNQIRGHKKCSSPRKIRKPEKRQTRAGKNEMLSALLHTTRRR